MITQTQKEVSSSTKDRIAVTEIGTQNSAKTKSFRTQYQKEDFEEEFQDIEKRQALIVKVSKPITKCKDMAVNTDITFQSRLQNLKIIFSITNRSQLMKGKLYKMRIQMITIQLVTNLMIVTKKKFLIKSSLTKIFSQVQS